jgi:hypothetical protein
VVKIFAKWSDFDGLQCKDRKEETPQVLVSAFFAFFAVKVWLELHDPTRLQSSAARRNQQSRFGQDEQDLQDKARTKPSSFCSFGILSILFILSMSFRK